MSIHHVYTCDTCHNDVAAIRGNVEDEMPKDIVGICFATSTEFHFNSSHSSDNLHICKECIKQFKREIGKYETRETK